MRRNRKSNNKSPRGNCTVSKIPQNRIMYSRVVPNSNRNKEISCTKLQTKHNEAYEEQRAKVYKIIR